MVGKSGSIKRDTRIGEVVAVSCNEGNEALPCEHRLWTKTA